MDNVTNLGSFQILNNLVMCDCAEERERAEAEAASKGKSSSSSSRQAGSEGSGTASTPECGFFTCGLGGIFSRRGGGAGGVCPSAGGWLPLAGALLLLAMMAYWFKNSDGLGSGSFSSLFSKGSKYDFKCK